MVNSYIRHYSGQYIEICFWFQHILQCHSNSQIHTFQCPKMKQVCYDTQILITSSKVEIYKHHLTYSREEKRKQKSSPNSNHIPLEVTSLHLHSNLDI